MRNRERGRERGLDGESTLHLQIAWHPRRRSESTQLRSIQSVERERHETVVINTAMQAPSMELMIAHAHTHSSMELCLNRLCMHKNFIHNLHTHRFGTEAGNEATQRWELTWM